MFVHRYTLWCGTGRLWFRSRIKASIEYGIYHNCDMEKDFPIDVVKIVDIIVSYA